MDERGERVEDPDLHVAALEPDRVRQGVAVDRGADDRRVDEPDVDVRQAGLPRDRPLRLAERLALDGVDQLLELGLGDRLVRPLALLAVVRREALDELAGDADDDLARPEAGHLLGLLERDRAVVDDRGDVGDRARLHVAAGPGACGRRRGPCRGRRRRSRRRAPWRTRSRCRAPCRRPAPRRSSRWRIRRQKAIQFVALGPETARRPPRAPSVEARRGATALALGHLRPAAAAAVDRGDAPRGRGRPPRCPVATRSSLTVTKSCGSSASRPERDDARRRSAADVLRGALERVDRLVRAGERDELHARRDLLGPAAQLARLRQAAAPPARLEPPLRLAQLVLERRGSGPGAPRPVWAPAASVRGRRASSTRGVAARRPRRRRSAPRSGASPSRSTARR